MANQYAPLPGSIQQPSTSEEDELHSRFVADGTREHSLLEHVETSSSSELVSPMSPNSVRPIGTLPTSLNSATELQKHEKSSNSLNRSDGPDPNVDSKSRTNALSWALELGAVILSVTAAITAVAVLRSQDGKPLDAWSFPTSINTMISALGTISRTSLAFAISACIGQQKWVWLRARTDQLLSFERFDEASRGPWGSTRLLIWLKARHWAALGALATLMFLAFDPFLQAIISYQGIPDNVRSSHHPPATIGRVQDLDIGEVIDVSVHDTVQPTPYGGLLLRSFVSKEDFGFASALYRGFDNSTVDPEPQAEFNCPTGNCTWPLFTSLAICASCNDVSSHITLEKWNITQLYSYPVSWTEYEWHGLHIGASDDAKWIGTFNAGHLGGITNTAAMVTANITTRSEDTITFRDSETLIMSYVVMRPSVEFYNGISTWNETIPVATECALYFCVNAYQTFSQMNILNETISKSWAEKEPASWLPNDLNLTAEYSTSETNSTEQFANSTAELWYEESINHTLDQSDSTMFLSDLQLTIPENDDILLPKLGLTTHRFNITQKSIFSIINFISKWSHTGESTYTNESGTFTYFDGYEDYHLTPLLEALRNSTDLNATFARVARSLTTYIRSTNMTQQGTVQQWVIYMKVDWTFIILPAIAICVGLLYVFLTIIETHRLALPVWKESARATLAYGLDNEAQELLRETDRAGQGWEMAAQMRVQFLNDGGGLKTHEKLFA